MNHFLRATPARLTEKAAAKLPRLVLVGVGLIYIFAGLFFRDPWKSDDVIGIATMLTLLDSPKPSQWLLLFIGDFAYTQDGPLATWVGAFSIFVFSPLFKLFLNPLDAAITAARLPNILWFGLLTFYFWRALYLLARTPAAQPLALPFGGEPNKESYGRMIADGGLLLLVATVGIIWRMHETSAVPLSLTLVAILFFGWVKMPEQPKKATFIIGLSLAASFFNRALIGFLPLFIASVAVFSSILPYRYFFRYFLASLFLAFTLIALWWFFAYQQNPTWIQHWQHWQLSQVKGWHWYKLSNSARDLLWFLWPTWP